MIFNSRLRRVRAGNQRPRGYAAPDAQPKRQSRVQPGGGGGGGGGAGVALSFTLAASTSESCQGAKSSLAPAVLELVTTLGVAMPVTVWLTWAGEAPGTNSRSRAATPPTAGAAIEVPDAVCQAFGSAVDPQ